MIVKIALDNDAKMPVKAHHEDAGFDLFSPKECVVFPHSSFVIDTGVHVEIPEGYVGFLKSKSGLNCNYGIVSEGVIDAGYTGSIKVKLYNHSETHYSVHKGDKITQLVILPIPDVQLQVVDQVEGGDRGNNGFGSSGR